LIPTPLRDRDELATVLALLLDLTPTESWLLAQLATRDYMAKNELHTALARSGRTTAPCTVVVFIHNLRKKIKDHGIEINTLYQKGYGLSATARGKLRSLLDQHDAGIIPTRSTKNQTRTAARAPP
jgi:DNA-binding winged helix-turn-helix (wHTH) protein